MTPLAQAIANDLTLPLNRRTIEHHPVVPKLLEAHCFDVTAVREVAIDLGQAMFKNVKKSATLAFLPAPVTWIEERNNDICAGYLLIERPEKFLADVYLLYRLQDFQTLQRKLFKHCHFGGTIKLQKNIGYEGGDESVLYDKNGYIMHRLGPKPLAFLYGALAIINTPRVVSRREHPPHVGLQRKLAAYHGVPGKFPLHPWSEIILEVSPPASHGGEYAPRLTGAKALHFCRAHLRIRLGRLEMVSAHWRGDAKLGIKPSRYRVVPKRSDVAA